MVQRRCCTPRRTDGNYGGCDARSDAAWTLAELRRGGDADGHRIHRSTAVGRAGLRARQWYAPRNGKVSAHGDGLRRHERGICSTAHSNDMLEGTKTERRTTSRGVVSHLVRNNRHVDLYALLSSAGLNVTNTNPEAFSPMHRHSSHMGGSLSRRLAIVKSTTHCWFNFGAPRSY